MLQNNQSIIIEIIDVNEPPVVLHIFSKNGQLPFPKDQPRIEENSLDSTVIGMVEAWDADHNETLALSLDDTAGGLFALSPYTSCGKLTNTLVWKETH